MSDQKAAGKKRTSNIKLEAVDFSCVCVCVCVCVIFTHHIQDSGYNDSPTVCIYLIKLTLEMLKQLQLLI